jgi:hypothetical protein|tara:strand:+ start:382 stop:564 length:183 start_codon:yes stop_codon:yes gene_type:complete
MSEGELKIDIPKVLEYLEREISDNGTICGLKRWAGHTVKVIVLPNKGDKKVNTTEEMNHE